MRLLSRSTVSHMASDHLGDMKVAGALPRGYTFGLGFAVRKETGLNSVPGSAGEFTWAGAAGTGFWIDPKEQMVVVLMTQNQPGPARGYDRSCSVSLSNRPSSTRQAGTHTLSSPDVVVRAAGRRGAGAPPAEARLQFRDVRAAGRRGARALPAEARL